MSMKKVTLLLALVIIPFSFYGFGNKFLELIHVYQGDAEGAFAVAPIVNYLLASGGFFLILCWAIANGMFHDIEGPKYWMLENEEQLDREADQASHLRSTGPPHVPASASK